MERLNNLCNDKSKEVLKLQEIVKSNVDSEKEYNGLAAHFKQLCESKDQDILSLTRDIQDLEHQFRCEKEAFAADLHDLHLKNQN
mmetsp:Transcript_32672/g.71200  ORF Transcript_32672/g.71200 Transcript_32672/m.71200 type:complete len:85 (+) Transcript_32672:1550-1804(+)